MKRFICLLVIIGMFFMVGCAGKSVNPDYDAYLNAKTVAMKESPPTFEIACPDGGCNFKKLAYYDPRDRIVISQKNPHPGWTFASNVAKYGFYGFASYYAFDFLGSVATTGSDAYTNSFNEVGGDNFYAPTNVGAGRDAQRNGPWLGDDNGLHESGNTDRNRSPDDSGNRNDSHNDSNITTGEVEPVEPVEVVE